MTGNVEDLPLAEQQKMLQELSDSFVEVVTESKEPITTREALTAVSDRMNVLVSEAKYGLTYAKTMGRVSLDQSTMRLTAAR